MKAVLISKISFLGITKSQYTFISVKGKDVVIEEIDKQKFDELKDQLHLTEAKPEDYTLGYDPSLGTIYTDGNFKSINKKKGLKRFIENTLKKI